MRQSSKAFTLIELLVVIAIIAILAAILFPVFAQAKLAAKKATSLSNQKQIALGSTMYVGDFDGGYYFAWGDCATGYSILLQPYIKASYVEGGGDFKDYGGVWNDPLHKGSYPMSYGTNSQITGICNWDSTNNKQGGNWRDSANESGINSPADVYLFGLYAPNWYGSWSDVPTDLIRVDFDGSNDGLPQPKNSVAAQDWIDNWLKKTDYSDGFQDYPWNCPMGAWDCKYFAFVYNRNGLHTGTTTLSFVDGHAKAMRYGQMTSKNYFVNPDPK